LLVIHVVVMALPIIIPFMPLMVVVVVLRHRHRD
jgi:hypothetical protein